MKRLVVQQDFVGGWNVCEEGEGVALLFRSDRIRSEGFARRLCSPEGGIITVADNTGAVLAEYPAKGGGRGTLTAVDRKSWSGMLGGEHRATARRRRERARR